MRTPRPPRDASLEGLHKLPPFVDKSKLTLLGDLLKVAETPTVTCIPGHLWISLRLDGCSFSKVLPSLKRIGLLEEGFSPSFARIMRACAVELMEEFHACCGFTQSDELTILIPPASVIRGEQQPHNYNGRVLKLCSMASSIVTARFLHELHVHSIEKNVPLPRLPHFDCRLGSYATEAEAFSLIIWRAYDCSINGVSDAVHRAHGGKIKLESTIPKLHWLRANGFLPLHPHQAYGSFFLKIRVLKEGENPLTGETKISLRSKITEAESDVLQLVAQGKNPLANLIPTTLDVCRRSSTPSGELATAAFAEVYPDEHERAEERAVDSTSYALL